MRASFSEPDLKLSVMRAARYHGDGDCLPFAVSESSHEAALAIVQGEDVGNRGFRPPATRETRLFEPTSIAYASLSEAILDDIDRNSLSIVVASRGALTRQLQLLESIFDAQSFFNPACYPNRSLNAVSAQVSQILHTHGTAFTVNDDQDASVPSLLAMSEDTAQCGIRLFLGGANSDDASIRVEGSDVVSRRRTGLGAFAALISSSEPSTRAKDTSKLRLIVRPEGAETVRVLNGGISSQVLIGMGAFSALYAALHLCFLRQVGEVMIVDDNASVSLRHSTRN